MTEIHPFIYFLPTKPNKLILGTFPCPNPQDYGNWYYSGSGRNKFWPLLSAVYNMPASTRAEKEFLCEKNGIAIADVGLEIYRTKGNCSDDNIEFIKYNRNGIETCISSGVETIFFTSELVQEIFKREFKNHDNIKKVVLMSPSGSKNRDIGRMEDYKTLIKSGVISNTFDYRLIQYNKELLK